MGEPTPLWLLVLCSSQALGDQGKAYRLMTELEHHLMKGTKNDKSNPEKPEVMVSRGATPRWMGWMARVYTESSRGAIGKL